MTPKRTAIIDFDGNFADVERSAQQAARRSGDRFAREFGAASDVRRIAQIIGTDLTRGIDADGVGRTVAGGLVDSLGRDINGMRVGQIIGADLSDGLDSGFDPGGLIGSKVSDLGRSLPGLAGNGFRSAGETLGGDLETGLSSVDARSLGKRIGADFGAGIEAGFPPGSTPIDVGRTIGTDLGGGVSEGFDPGAGVGAEIDSLAGALEPATGAAGLAAGGILGGTLLESFGEILGSTDPIAAAGLDDAAAAAGTDAGNSWKDRFGETITDEVGLAALGATAGAIVIAGFAEAVDRQAGKGLIQAQLGLSTGEAARYGDIAGSVFADNFGSSIGASRAAVVAVDSSLAGMRSAGSAALKDVSEKALAFSDIFEQDVSEAVSTAGVLIENDLARDGIHALDLMTAASQRMPAGLRDELGPIAREYGQFFAQLGFSGEEAFGLLTDASQRGEFVLDKLGDAVKEYSILSTDGSEATASAYETIGLSAGDMSAAVQAGGDQARAALDRTIAGILGIEDPTTQATTALALFGTPLEDLGTSQIPEFLDSLRSGESTLGDVTGATQDASDAVGAGLGATLETVRRQSMGLFVGFIEDRVLPGLTNITTGTVDLAQGLWRHAEPAADDVTDALGSLWSVGKNVADTAVDMVTPLAGIGGSAVLTGLAGVASSLEVTFGWLDRNQVAIDLLAAGVITFAALQAWPVIVSAIETMYIRWLYFQGAVTGSAITTGLAQVATGFGTMGVAAWQGAGTARAGLGMVRAGAAEAASAISPVTVGLLAIVGTAVLYKRAWDNARQANADWRAEVEQDIDPLSIDSYETALDEANQRAKESLKYLQDIDASGAGVLGGWKAGAIGVAQAFTPLEDNLVNSSLALEDSVEAMDDFKNAERLLTDSLAHTSNALGVTREEARGLYRDLDLTPTVGQIDENTDLIRAHLTGLAEEAGYRGPQIKDALSLGPEELKARQAEWDELSGAVASSWHSALDAVSGLGSIEEITGDKIGFWFASQQVAATKFGENLTTAFALGYDPTFLADLLEAGPAEAGPIIEGIVNDHSATLLWQVNAGVVALQSLSDQAVEMARLTHAATTAESSAMAADLGEAMQITQWIGTLGARATADAIAREMRIGVDEVNRIAADYGIKLAGSINPVLSIVGKEQIPIGGGFLRNTGGLIPGSGPDRDSVPAWLTTGEYVQRRKSVQTWGTDAMDALNAGHAPPGWLIPGHNAGGRVTGDLDGLHPALLARLTAWSAAVGQPYHVGSGYRSIAEQRRLYAAYLAGRGPLAAVPGSSMHNYGLASDGNHWGRRNPAGFGLSFAVPGEPWHVQPVEARAMRDDGVAAHGAYFAPPPKPKEIGWWPLAEGGEGAMWKGYDATVDWLATVTMSAGMPSLGSGFGSNRELGQAMAAERGWTGPEWSALNLLWDRESGWNERADNPTSSAYGIPQALPGRKMASHGADWQTNPATQIAWGFDYIDDRYETPTQAWAAWNARSPHWYNAGGPVTRHQRPFDSGGVLAPGWNLVDNQTGAPEPLTPARPGPALNVEGDIVVKDRTDIDLLAHKVGVALMRPPI